MWMVRCQVMYCIDGVMLWLAMWAALKCSTRYVVNGCAVSTCCMSRAYFIERVEPCPHHSHVRITSFTTHTAVSGDFTQTLQPR